MNATIKRKRVRQYWDVMAAKAVLLFPEICAEDLEHGLSFRAVEVFRALNINWRLRTNGDRFRKALIKARPYRFLRASGIRPADDHITQNSALAIPQARVTDAA